MTKEYALINKDTLRLLREKSRISFDYIERKTEFSESIISEWEDNGSSKLPTINQAKDLAKCYQVPFAGLYMRPNLVNLKNIPSIRNMRSLFGGLASDDSALNLATMKLLGIRDLIFETKTELNESIPKFEPDQVSSVKSDVEVLARRIREFFNLRFTEQIDLDSKRKFYLYIKKKVEAKGIIVHCFSGVEIESARGLSVYFDIFPIIGINDSDRYPAKSFSIIHELVHLLNHSSTYCNEMSNSFSKNIEEIFCNAVAAETLVPREAVLTKFIKREDNDVEDHDVEKLSNIFSVSREVIVRRLLDVGSI